MPYTIAEFQNALAKVDLGDSPSVYLTARLLTLGFLSDGATKKEKLTLLYDAIRGHAGEERTITVSTSNWTDINVRYDFDHDNRPSNEGALTEFIRTLPGAVRSIHPFVNFTSIGPLAHDIADNVSRHDFGPDSVFDRLLNLNTIQMQIGLNPARALTLLHHVEFIRGVPYRYHKEFPFTVTSNGKTYQECFYTNARFLSSEIRQDYTRKKLFDTLHEMGYRIEEVPVGAGAIYSYRWSEMFEAISEVLSRDPYGLLESAPKTRIYATTM